MRIAVLLSFAALLPGQQGLTVTEEFGVPSYNWIGAREKRRTEFTVFVEKIGEDYRGTRDVRMEGGEPKLVGR